jgi:hypothetical protein
MVLSCRVAHSLAVLFFVVALARYGSLTLFGSRTTVPSVDTAQEYRFARRYRLMHYGSLRFKGSIVMVLSKLLARLLRFSHIFWLLQFGSLCTYGSPYLVLSIEAALG